MQAFANCLTALNVQTLKTSPKVGFTNPTWRIPDRGKIGTDIKLYMKKSKRKIEANDVEVFSMPLLKSIRQPAVIE